MAELATMARPYANAAFDVAKRDSDLGSWSKALAYLAQAAGEPTVRSLLESPDMEAPVKAQKLIEVCGDALDDRTKRFVQVLASNKRLPLIGEIADQFEALRAAEEQQIDVEVVSAKPERKIEKACGKRTALAPYSLALKKNQSRNNATTESQ